MADGVCLLVDALKDQCTDTFCITKALDLGLKPCVVNKVDKENCPEEVHEKVLT
jgi:predicted membrane GTPase involved in stress response